jgi:hypothetical protein
MAGSDPKEYLSLIASENENYSEVYDKRFDIASSCGALLLCMKPVFDFFINQV